MKNITDTKPIEKTSPAPAPISTARRTKTRVLIVDDHPLLRKGVVELVNAEKDFEVVGEAEDTHRALTAIEVSKPDVALVDITLGGGSGIELLKDIRVRFPKLLVLVLSMHDETVYAHRALRAGASGYIMKQEGAERVVTALRKVMKGEVYLSERLGSRMLTTLVGGRATLTGSPIEALSDRELEVFTLIGHGHGTRPIAEKLHLSVKTIESHRAHIKEKLNLQNATELVHHAIQWVQSEKLAVPGGAAMATA
ncbi:MAG TPA: response regulator transcription factor [Verrucomicrobiae bacterium]|jgi:DNA-binding NarL/FixJ family response regulator|nr:response regulator transcription factor [Verrucomicrobiae bacterium]